MSIGGPHEVLPPHAHAPCPRYDASSRLRYEGGRVTIARRGRRIEVLQARESEARVADSRQAKAARASDCCYRNDRGRRRVEAAVEKGPAQLLTTVMRERAEFRSMVA